MVHTETVIIEQAMQMIRSQDMRGWTAAHDAIILGILKGAKNENA